jgi:hypothetical protein
LKWRVARIPYLLGRAIDQLNRSVHEKSEQFYSDAYAWLQAAEDESAACAAPIWVIVAAYL